MLERDALATIAGHDVKGCNPIRRTGLLQRECSLITEVAIGGSAEPQNVRFGGAVATLDAGDLDPDLFQGRHMVEQDQICGGDALERRRVANQHAVAGGGRDVAEQFEGDAHAGTGAVIWPEDSRRHGEIADEKADSGGGQRRGNCAGRALTVWCDRQAGWRVNCRRGQFAGNPGGSCSMRQLGDFNFKRALNRP